jgi:competence protein ComEA
MRRKIAKLPFRRNLRHDHGPGMSKEASVNRLAFAILLALGLVAASPLAAQTAAPGAAPKPAAAAPASTAKPIDINKASKKELMTLPGIGDVYAEKIIKARPFKGKDDIMSDKVGVPQATYDKIKDMIIAKQK